MYTPSISVPASSAISSMRVRRAPGSIGVNLLNRGMISTGYTKFRIRAITKKIAPPMSHHVSTLRTAT